MRSAKSGATRLTTQLKVLYTSADVHRAIHKLLVDPTAGRRVVLAAYVGPSASSYLPRPKGLTVVCAPAPGVTSARAIRDLVGRDADVRFSDKLHMKVYWSEKRGCVITSANVSQSALGANGLREAGVFLTAGVVDIERLLRAASPRDRTAEDMALLDRTPVRPPSGSKAIPPEPPYDFAAWYRSPDRQQWLLSWFSYDSKARVSDAGTAWVKETYGSGAYEADPLQHKKGQLAMGDWVLTYWKDDHKFGNPAWMYVNHVHRVPKTDSQYQADYPYEALQTMPLRQCPTPPFRITPDFRRAFRKAVRVYGLDRLYTDDVRPPRAFIDTLFSNMRG